MRLVAIFFGVLLLALVATASQSCRPSALQARAPITMLAVTGNAAGHSAECRALVGVETEALPAAGASEAVDTQPEPEDGADALAAGLAAVGPATPAQARAAIPARDVPSPWLGGLLRPPRTRQG